MRKTLLLCLLLAGCMELPHFASECSLLYAGADVVECEDRLIGREDRRVEREDEERQQEWRDDLANEIPVDDPEHQQNDSMRSGTSGG